MGVTGPESDTLKSTLEIFLVRFQLSVNSPVSRYRSGHSLPASCQYDNITHYEAESRIFYLSTKSILLNKCLTNV